MKQLLRIVFAIEIRRRRMWLPSLLERAEDKFIHRRAFIMFIDEFAHMMSDVNFSLAFFLPFAVLSAVRRLLRGARDPKRLIKISIN